MSNKEKSDIIDQMINENPDYTILDYLKLIGELETIERFTSLTAIPKKSMLYPGNYGSGMMRGKEKKNSNLGN